MSSFDSDQVLGETSKFLYPEPLHQNSKECKQLWRDVFVASIGAGLYVSNKDNSYSDTAEYIADAAVSKYLKTFR